MTTDCWPHEGYIDKRSGYGMVTVGTAGRHKKVGAHRLAWESVAGPIPPGRFVLHVCDNRACTRNDDEGTYEVEGRLLPRRGHLFLGTIADNNADARIKGRMAKGERSGQAVLTDRQADEIRVRYVAGGILQRELAEQYGVERSVIMDVLRGRTYGQEKAGRSDVVRLKAAAYHLGLTEAAVHRRIKQGQIETVRIGRYWCIPISILLDLMPESREGNREYCRKGHPLDPASILTVKDGDRLVRKCRICRSASQRRADQKRRHPDALLDIGMARLERESERVA